MTGLRWIRLNKTGLETVPYELANLKKLVSGISFRNFPIIELWNLILCPSLSFSIVTISFPVLVYINEICVWYSVSLMLYYVFICLKEHLSFLRNNLRDLHSDVANLPNLRVLNVSHNKLKNASIPDGLFKLEDLSVVVRIFFIDLDFVSLPHWAPRWLRNELSR